jgi:hypothetical protein
LTWARGITVATERGQITYRLTPVLEVTLNVQRAAAAGLAPGMSATPILAPSEKEVREIQAGQVPASQALRQLP